MHHTQSLSSTVTSASLLSLCGRSILIEGELKGETEWFCLTSAQQSLQSTIIEAIEATQQDHMAKRSLIATSVFSRTANGMPQAAFSRPGLEATTEHEQDSCLFHCAVL